MSWQTLSEMPLCGPKLSLCGVVLSIWGIIQLSIMGVFFYINSVALIEDINLEESYESMDRLRTDMDKGYQQNALNCWIAGNHHGQLVRESTLSKGILSVSLNN